MTEQSEPSLRRELLALPRVMGTILLKAGIVASILAMLLTNTIQSVVVMLPAEIWFEPQKILIPDVDMTRPLSEQYATFVRDVHREPILASWDTQFVIVDDAGREYCRNRGTGLYGPASNGLTILVPMDTYIPEDCNMPPGCYYQDRHYEFEVFDIKKAINVRSNSFAVTTATGRGRCT